MEQYRFDVTGAVFEYSYVHDAYLYIGHTNGRTESEFIADYEEMMLFSE